MKYLILLISSVFVNNVVLTQLFGISPLLVVTRKVESTIYFSIVVATVLVFSTILNFLVETYILIPFHIEYFQIVAFVVLILIVSRIVQITLSNFPTFVNRFQDNFFVLLVANSTILGASLLAIKNEFDFLTTVVFAFGSAIGYLLVMIIFSAIQEHLRLEKIPKSMEGYPILLIAAGLLAMAFVGFQ